MFYVNLVIACIVLYLRNKVNLQMYQYLQHFKFQYLSEFYPCNIETRICFQCIKYLCVIPYKYVIKSNICCICRVETYILKFGNPFCLQLKHKCLTLCCSCGNNTHLSICKQYLLCHNSYGTSCLYMDFRFGNHDNVFFTIQPILVYSYKCWQLN